MLCITTDARTPSSVYLQFHFPHTQFVDNRKPIENRFLCEFILCTSALIIAKDIVMEEKKNDVAREKNLKIKSK